jgi:hypothetical protein
MTDLQDILLRVLRELGPNASDDEIGKKMGEYIEALSDSDKAEAMEQMVRLTTSTELAHLRQLAEEVTGEKMPDQIIEKRDDENRPS